MDHMNPITRRLAARPAQFLADMVDNRRRCPRRDCDGGVVSGHTEPAGRYYPGWVEARPCPECEGKGWIPTSRRYRRALDGAA